MTNIDYKSQLQRPAHRLTCVKWRGLLPHQYASSGSKIHQRSSCLTQRSSSTRQFFTRLQRSWWSHCLAPFLPRPGVRAVSSCLESSVPIGKGEFYKNGSLHHLFCSGIWIGEHNQSHHQSIGRTIQRTVRGIVVPTDVLVDPRTIVVQVLLPTNEALLVEAYVPADARIIRGQQAAR